MRVPNKELLRILTRSNSKKDNNIIIIDLKYPTIMLKSVDIILSVSGHVFDI